MMSLAVYKRKRNFSLTPEPIGEAGKSGHSYPVFVVQKHAASRLHYDFRLEMEGVLKSWAIPKGPSMNPGDKRLAVMVEDHPYGYKDFEGRIPEGNYGAGTVIVWDHGTYLNSEHPEAGSEERFLLEALHNGNLKIFLNGKKLMGEFALIRLKGKKGNEWLFLKKNDSNSTSEDILKKDKSVISNRTLEEVSGKNNQRTVLLQRKIIRKKKFISGKTGHFKTKTHAGRNKEGAF